MATKSSLRSKWDEFVDSSTATAVELSDTNQMSTGVRNVVGWLKQVYYIYFNKIFSITEQFHFCIYAY